eukprot:TRINITY_DN2021_c0_g3_i2.p1 TRINITY_DN2021_c0_g3~~TRINITY_DN2021_c0_g3_i2.p1  ORF type:complete len:210 (-),score=27.74 TRINITY_DN2021_c0_g3_i2:462-1091(-)
MARLSKDQYIKEQENLKKIIQQFPEFQNNNFLNMILRMVDFEPAQRPKIIEICQIMINSKSFYMNTLNVNNMQTLIMQLIEAFNQKTTVSKINEQVKILEQKLEEQKAIITKLTKELANNSQTIAKSINQNLFPKFSSNILKNPLHSAILLALFQKQTISLEILYQQYNISELDKISFHEKCDNKGSTLVVMHSYEEPNSFFGGLAVSS